MNEELNFYKSIEVVTDFTVAFCMHSPTISGSFCVIDNKYGKLFETGCSLINLFFV